MQGTGVGNAGSLVRFEEVPVTITEAGTGAGGGGEKSWTGTGWTGAYSEGTDS